MTRPQGYGTCGAGMRSIQGEVGPLRPSQKVAAVNPRFFQPITLYPDYLRGFYPAHPKLLAAPFQAQVDALLDGFSDLHIFSRRLKGLGFETGEAIINDLPSQGSWLRENGVPVTASTGFQDVLIAQIDEFKPDILYTTDVLALNRGLFARLKHRPKVVAGWRGFPMPAGTDLSHYDLILTSFDRIFDEAKACGARKVERFHPGFSETSPIIAAPRAQAFDVMFSGSVTGHHTRRIALLNTIADMSRDEGFSFGLFMPDAGMLSPFARSLNQAALWGPGMLRAMRNAGMVINIDIDEFGNQPPNMRLIEATGAGAFLLTPDHPDLPQFFEPGAEVETFRTPQELIAKIRYYLKEPEARLAIAERGQRRCLKDHSLAQRTPWFRDLMMAALARA